MAKPYSEDLRRRVVGTIEGGTTIPEAAEQCGVIERFTRNSVHVLTRTFT
jgi:hypothetical protein